MMRLRVQLFGRLGARLGSNIEFEFENEPTIRTVINKLIQRDPSLEPLLLKKNKLNTGTILLINGHIVDKSETGLDRKLRTKDRVTIDALSFLESVGGG